MEILVKNNAPLIILMEGEYIDPEFLKMGQLSMQDSLHCPPNIIADKLAHQITRFPNDLRSHTQRIIIFIEQCKIEALYSGLVDLFLILGDKGAALRKRLLLMARSVLPDHQFDFLQQALSAGLDSNISVIDANQSILSHGRKNKTPFIAKNSIDASISIGLMEQVDSYLEYGQLDEARLLLEKSLLENPLQQEGHQDLAVIFQKMANKALFVSFYEELLKLDVTLPLIWEQVADGFNDENKK